MYGKTFSALLVGGIALGGCTTTGSGTGSVEPGGGHGRRRPGPMPARQRPLGRRSLPGELRASLMAMKSVLDRSFRYVPSVHTDLRKTFARIRRERQRAQARSAPVVLSIKQRKP